MVSEVSMNVTYRSNVPKWNMTCDIHRFVISHASLETLKKVLTSEIAGAKNSKKGEEKSKEKISCMK